MKLPGTLRRSLEHLFLHESLKGGKRIGVNITTNPTRIRVGELHALARKGLISYEENDHFTQFFGVHAWDVVITDLGRKALEEVL